MRLYNDDRVGRSKSLLVHHRVAPLGGGEQLNGHYLVE